MFAKALRLILLIGFVGSFFLFQSLGWRELAQAARPSLINSPDHLTLPSFSPASPLFSPSNAQTVDGQYIQVEQFFSASRCQECHQDTHAAWANSLHRNAAREPFYRESADILLKTRGIEFTRHCESCHTPVALFSGALSKTAPKQTAPFTPLDDEGITCAVCHSITEARLDGTGSYTLRRPALLANTDGTPIYEINQQPVNNEQILADIPAHKRAVMRPLLRTPEFCATCHKVDAPPDLNNYKHIRGFSAYDEWQQSGASHESVLPFYRRDQRTDCRACHMPKIESRNDRAAKAGKIASHQWLGANTAAPLFYGQQKQAADTAQFLQAEVAEVDIFALRRLTTGERLAPLASDAMRALSPGEEVIAEVVVSNRNAAHSFPPEVRDLYEAWIEFEVLDSTGKPIFHSGFLKPDGLLDESAHVYKQIILDEQGRQITRHQIWTTNVKVYDNTIPPGRSDVVQYRFRWPEMGRQGIRLRARLNYRRFNQEYTKYVLQRQQRQMTVPVVKMAEASINLVAQQATNAAPALLPQWKRWNDYGIALLEQAQFGAAASAFCRAAELNPTDPNLCSNIAIAEMGTERFGTELEQFKKAEMWLECALTLDPVNQRARFYRAQVWRAQGRIKEAAAELGDIAMSYPRDREVQRQYGQTLFTLGRMTEARQRFEALLRVDPTDFSAWQFLVSLYAGEGRADDATAAQQKYWQWRDDPQADASAARFFSAHPEWADERIRFHVHGTTAVSRPILTGQQAVPDK